MFSLFRQPAIVRPFLASAAASVSTVSRSAAVSSPRIVASFSTSSSCSAPSTSESDEYALEEEQTKTAVKDVEETMFSRKKVFPPREQLDQTTSELLPPSLLQRVPAKANDNAGVVHRLALDPTEYDPEDPHPLYAFFHRDSQGNFVTSEELTEEELVSSRPFECEELRLKSFQDLHTLWYLLLREKNVYYTQKEHLAMDKKTQTVGARRQRQKIQLSMARIKRVLNERRLAYELVAEAQAANAQAEAEHALALEEWRAARRAEGSTEEEIEREIAQMEELKEEAEESSSKVAI